MMTLRTANDFAAIAGNYQAHVIQWQTDAYKQDLQERLKSDSNCHLCHLSGDIEFFLLDSKTTSKNAVATTVLACQYCMKLKLLDQYNLDYQGKDKLMYLPQMTQFELNHLYYVYHQLKNDPSAKLKCKKIVSELQSLSLHLDEMFGVTMSHPGTFVHYLNSSLADEKLLMNVRWLDGELLKSEFSE